MAKYKNIIEGIFLYILHHFIAYVLIDDKIEVCHVKNSGWCRELLVHGCKIYVIKADNPERTTQYELIAVVKTCTDSEGREFNRLINMDTQIPSKVAYEWIMDGGLGFPLTYLKKEVIAGKSRFDFYCEFSQNNSMKKAFIEVRGVLSEKDGVTQFPKIYTKRGLKHIYQLIECRKQGYEAYLLFVMQMSDVSRLEADDTTDPDFHEALILAREAGVKILALGCNVTEDEIAATHFIDIIF